MNFIDVLCVCNEVPTVRSGTLHDCAEDRMATPELIATFLDQETGERPSPPVAAKCNRYKPGRKGLFVAHVAVDETCGITQVGNIEWQPLAPVFRAYLATATA